MSPDLKGDIRDLVLFAIQDAIARLHRAEEFLCLSEEEENLGESNDGVQ